MRGPGIPRTDAVAAGSTRGARARARVAGALALAALSVAGCDVTEVGTFRVELSRNELRWESQAPESYRYAVRRSCFCAPPSIGPVRMEVVDGTVVSAVYVEDGTPFDPELAQPFPTVEGLFAVLADAAERDAARIDVTWDPETGIPLEFFIDYDERIADEELGYSVTELPEPIDP